jgi:hypothetical protein
MSHAVRRALLAALLVVASAGPVVAQITPAQRRKALMEGTHVFRRILYDEGFKALKSYDSLTEAPKKTLLVVLGDLDKLDNIKIEGGLKHFVERGGAVLLASDRPPRVPRAAKDLRAVAGVGIGKETFVSANDASVYKHMPYCPVLEPQLGAQPALLAAAPGEVGPLRVATNVPSSLERRGARPGTIQPLAFLPRDCVPDTWQVNFWRFTQQLFLVGGEVGQGRVLVLADHSIFINEMMLPTDNHNVEFTINCVRWLRGGGADGPRDRVLMVEDGNIQIKLDIPLKSAIIPPEEALRLLLEHRNELLAEAEKVVARFDNSAVFNEALHNALQRLGLMHPGRLLLLATLGALLYGIYRLGLRHRFRHPGEAPLLATAVGQTLPAAPLVDQRAYLLLRLGNLNEPAAALAARWLARQGLTAEDGPAEPPVEVAGGWWRRLVMRRRLGRLWRLAQGRSSERLGPAGLWRLQRELDQLEAARQRGEWRPLEVAA